MGRAYASERERLRRLLQQMRGEAKLTQKEVARRIGYSQSYVSKYENGEIQLDFVIAWAVSRALGVSLPRLARRFERGR